MTRERIADLRLKQKDLITFADQVDPPSVAFIADQDAIFIKGNEAGLINFAAVLLEVASGANLNASNPEWLGTPYLPLEGITLDPDPTYKEPKQSFWSALGAYSFLGMCSFVS